MFTYIWATWQSKSQKSATQKLNMETVALILIKYHVEYTEVRPYVLFQTLASETIGELF